MNFLIRMFLYVLKQFYVLQYISKVEELEETKRLLETENIHLQVRINNTT